MRDDEKPTADVRPGQPPLGHKVRTTYFNFAMLEEHHEYLKERAESEGVSIAAYLRELIQRDMDRDRRPPSPQDSPQDAG